MIKQQILAHATQSMRDVLCRWDALSACGDYGVCGPGGPPWGGKRESSAETLARSILAATPLIVNGLDVDGINLSGFYADRILEMAENPDFEPRLDKYDQVTIEVAGICACLLTLENLGHDILENLSPAHQAVVVNWVTTYEHALVLPNNWRLFPLVIGSWVNRHNRTHSDMPHQIIEASQWQGIDCLHVGSGWYQDGLGGEIDHYTSWSFQWYSLILVMSNSFDTPTAKTVIERSIQFAERLAARLALGGLPVSSRSQCYREAASAALALVHLVAKPIHGGHQLLETNWQQWKDSTDFNGVVRDYYSCSASPMWRFKWYWQALLPDDDVWWKAARYTVRSTPANGATVSDSAHAEVAVHG